MSWYVCCMEYVQYLTTILLILRTRSTIGSFGYLTHTGGHCLLSYRMDLGCLRDSQLCHPFLMRLLSSVADTQSSATMGISLEHVVFEYNISSTDTTRRFIINPDEIFLKAFFQVQQQFTNTWIGFGQQIAFLTGIEPAENVGIGEKLYQLSASLQTSPRKSCFNLPSR
jgi:hypothetical protein